MKKMLLFMIEKMLLYKKKTSQGDFGTMQPFHCCLTSLNKDIENLAKINKKEKLGGFCCSCEHWKYYGKKDLKFIIIGDQTPIVHIKSLLILIFLF